MKLRLKEEGQIGKSDLVHQDALQQVPSKSNMQSSELEQQLGGDEAFSDSLGMKSENIELAY